MSLSEKVKVRPYICGVFLCFGTSFTASTSFQNFYDTDILEADVVSLYATSSKVKFTETKTSTRAGYQYKQNISISLPIADELRSEHITRIHQAEQVVLKLTNGEYLFLGRNDAGQNTKPKISYFGNEDVARFEFVNTSMAASGYTDIDSIGEIPDDFLFVLLDNGVTIRYLGNTPGDTGLAFGDDSGIVYTAVDDATIRQLDSTVDDFTSICTTLCTDLGQLFRNQTSFNQDIGSWDTSKVIDLQQIFENASSFNQNINNWDVSKVNDFRNTFFGASVFNSPLDLWDVSSGTLMIGMFEKASAFNQNINNWDVSNVLRMDSMFSKALKFNQPLNSWNTVKVFNMGRMFFSAHYFNQPLYDWNVSNVINMQSMFENTINFNQNINDWDVSSVTNMREMFRQARSFNLPLYNWNVSNVTNMIEMFFGVFCVFNQNISNWCVQQIPVEPDLFSFASPLDSNPSFKPNWGAPC